MSNSSIKSNTAAGLFRVAFQTRADQVDEALKTANEIIQNFITNGPTEEEIEIALDRIRGGSVFKTSSNGKTLSAVSSVAFHKRPLDYLETYVAEYEKENRESVISAYRKYLHPDKMVTVIVGGTAEQSARE